MRVLLLLLFPVFCSAQTFVKDRFMAKNGAILWSEKFEMKDMDTPIIVETLTEKLKNRAFVKIDSAQKEDVLEGSLVAFASIEKARFRVDFLYESYVVTLTSIIAGGISLESLILKKEGEFVEKLPNFVEKLDGEVIVLFLITH